MADDDLRSLIFHPGMTTSAEVTHISGRGIGMDVVRDRVESLRGRVSVHSVAGEGHLDQPEPAGVIDSDTLRFARYWRGNLCHPIGSDCADDDLAARQCLHRRKSGYGGAGRAPGTTGIHVRHSGYPRLRRV